MTKLHLLIKNILRPYYRVLQRLIERIKRKFDTNRLLFIPKESKKQRIFYFGITEHSNLGDLAQYFCIRKWLKENYPNSIVFEFEATTIVSESKNFVKKLKRVFGVNDFIIFQSGYCTQDLGGNHEQMHRIIFDEIPNARVLMMPQTIFFNHEVNKQRTSKSYNQNPNHLFLARDRVSYELALSMFPDITVLNFPDIVTSLIGNYHFEYQRDNVLFCCRDDSEKYYSENEIDFLRKRVETICSTELIDTTIATDFKEIRKDLKNFVEDELRLFAKYKLVITDRYHGTIFSIIAGTPVIVIKTNDHKVTTGVEWFHGIFDDYVYLANSLEHAFELTKSILENPPTSELSRYFNSKYYGELKSIFDNN